MECCVLVLAPVSGETPEATRKMFEASDVTGIRVSAEVVTEGVHIAGVRANTGASFPVEKDFSS